MFIFADIELPVMIAAIICELVLLGFLFCIGRFFELKFGESTYYVSYLIPVFVFMVLLAVSFLSPGLLTWAALITNAAVLLVMLTFGLHLYRKMTGVSR